MRLMRFAAPLRIGILTIALASNAQSGVVGQTCEPGYVSESGFEPCTPCGGGTFNPFFGAATCQTCPEGTYASAPGRASCAEPVTIHFEGIVSGVAENDTGPNPIEVGMPLTGYCVLDPTVQDAEPLAHIGSYDALLELSVRAGPVGSATTGVASSGFFSVVNGEGGPQDSVAMSTDLAGFMPAGEFERLRFDLDEFPGTALSSDSLEEALAVFDAFSLKQILWQYGSGAASVTDASIFVPEPSGGAAGIVAGAAVAWRRIHRRQALPRTSR
jgi:hypothetical protein